MGSRSPFSLRHQSRVWNLLRASRRLFNFTPLRRRSAELTGIEMCREEKFFHQEQTLRPNCYQTHSFIKHLEGGWVQLVAGEVLFIVSLCVLLCSAVFSEEYTVSDGADYELSPQATTRPSLLRSVLTKARLLLGGGAAFVVDLCFWTVPSQPPVFSQSSEVELNVHIYMLRTLNMIYAVLPFLFLWDER